MDTLKKDSVVLLILLSILFLLVSFVVQKNEILVGTIALLIALNFIVSLTYLFRQGKITSSIIFLNILQIAFFCRLFPLIHDVLGADHYSYELPPMWYDWLELVTIHVFRAIDLLDILSAYDIDLQSVHPNSSLVGGILVSMHAMVDIFIMGAILIFIRHRSAAMKKNGILDFFGEKTGYFLKILRHTIEACVIFFVIYIAISNQWGMRNFLLWCLDNLVRTLDFGDAMEIFDWQSHDLEMDIWLETLAVLFRIVVSVYILGLANIIFLHLFGGGGKTMDELSAICNSNTEYSPKERRLALSALIKFKSSAVIPHLVTTLGNRNSYIRHAAAQALKKVDNQWQKSDIGIQAIQNFAITLKKDKNEFSRQAAAEALGLVGPSAVKVVPTLVKALVDKKRNVRNTAANTLKKIAPNWSKAGSKKRALQELVNGLIGTKKEIHDITLEILILMGPETSVEILPLFIQTVANSNVKIRAAVAQALLVEENSLSNAMVGIVCLLADSPERSFAISILGKLPSRTANKTIPILIKALKNKNMHIRSFAAIVLGHMGPYAHEAVYQLILTLVDKDLEVFLAASTALEEISPDWQHDAAVHKALPYLMKVLSGDNLMIDNTKFIPILINALSTEEKTVRCQIVTLLCQIDATNPQVIQGLTTALNDKDDDICYAAVVALGNIGAPAIKACLILVTILKHDNKKIQHAVSKTLVKIKPKWWKDDEIKDAYEFFTEFGFKTTVKK